MNTKILVRVLLSATLTVPLPATEHAAWLAQTIARADRRLYVAELEGNEPIGTARLDREAGAWEVSITVEPKQRGRGIAMAVLAAIEREARSAGVMTLTARIRANNARSVAAFKKAGYYGFLQRELAGEAFLFCERRVAPWSANVTSSSG